MTILEKILKLPEQQCEFEVKQFLKASIAPYLHMSEEDEFPSENSFF